jgi:bifunctional non-homologous end joining protein LigD
MVWDQGTWTPLSDDVARSMEKGELKFELHGKKLRGSWALVRTNYSRGGGSSKESWLLIKHKDEAAEPGAKVDVVDALPDSVVSGRAIGRSGVVPSQAAAARRSRRRRRAAGSSFEAASAVSAAA